MPEFKGGDVVRHKAQTEFHFVVTGITPSGRIECERIYESVGGALLLEMFVFLPSDIEPVPPKTCDGPCSPSIEGTVERATVEELLREAADRLEVEGFDRLAGQIDFVITTYETADERVAK